MASTLGSHDLGKLLKKYSIYQLWWFDIGLQLGIEVYHLNIIKVNNHNESGVCFREMLSHWLYDDQSATEYDLQEAIEFVKKNQMWNSSTKFVPAWEVYAVNGRNTCPPKCYYFTAIIVAIVAMASLISYPSQQQYSSIEIAAETLKNEYKTHKIIKFNLPVSDNTNMEYLSVVLTHKNGHEFGVGELVQNYTGKDGRLIITGQPGSGKTTLLRHLAKEWAHERAFQSCQILFLINLGALEGEPKTFSDLLSKSGFGDIKNLKSVAEEIYASKGAGACLLLDAYDELKWNRYNFIDDIIEGSKIPSSFCLLSSRPILGEKFKVLTQMKVIGYNIDELSYNLNKLSNNATLISSIQLLWIYNKGVKEMCTLPLHMVMLLYVYHYESSVTIRTTTQLYIAFMNVTIKYYEGHRHKWNAESLWQCIRANSVDEDDLCVAFNSLHKAAYDMVFKGQDLFPENNDIKEYINQLSFVGITSVPGSKSQVRYTFSHPTFLEFFAALHLTTLPVNEQLAFLACGDNDTFISKLPLKMHLIFYFGFVGDLFRFNTSAVYPFIKQFFSDKSELILPCSMYNVLDRVLGWTSKEYKNAIDSALKAKYSLCACRSFHILSDCTVSRLTLRDDGELALYCMKLMFVLTLSNCLTEQDLLRLQSCIDDFKHEYSNCACCELRLPSVVSLTINFFPKPEDLYIMKRVFPNLEFLKIRVNWMFDFIIYAFSHLFEQYEIVSTLITLRLEVHLRIDIERCSIRSITMRSCINQINQVTVYHVRIFGVCHSSYAELLCNSALQHLTIYINDSAHAQSLIDCIHQAQNLKVLDFIYSEGAIDRMQQKGILRNLPNTLQTLNIGEIDQNRGMCCTEFNFSSSYDVRDFVDPLIVKENLLTLMISISNEDDMKMLTQLASLVHLHLILDETSGSLDKSSVLSIVRQLQHFPHLDTFKLTANCDDWSRQDRQNVLSTIFAVSSASEVHICLGPKDSPPYVMHIIQVHFYNAFWDDPMRVIRFS